MHLTLVEDEECLSFGQSRMGIAKVRFACNLVIFVHANTNLDMDDRLLQLLEILVSYVLFHYYKCIREELRLR